MKHYGDIAKIKGSEGSVNPYKVYVYRFPNGKTYIGMTKNTLAERRDMGYQHNPHLQKAIREFGWCGFEHEIVRSNLTREEAERLEIELIKEYDSTNPCKGYNISVGGRATFAGLRHTPEYRQRMSELNKGKVFSSETIKKMKHAHEKERKPVVAQSDDGRRMLFESLNAAADFVKGYPSNISRACIEKKKYKGMAWTYVN